MTARPSCIAFAAAILVGTIASARADLEVCNHTSFVAEAAIGIESAGAAATRGWFRVDPGTCRAVLRGDPNAGRLFVHARALPIYGSVRPLNAATVQLCVGDGDFIIPAARRCSGGDRRLVGFAEVRPRATETGLTVRIAEPADYAPEQARLAAIQRLLTLAGYDAEPIDGVAGPRTDAALSQFLRERGLAPEAAAAPAFLDRLMEAVRDGAGPGLVWCNETAHTVMAALAWEERGSLLARGWWRIEPGACVRPELPRRTSRVYSFAEAVDQSGAAVERGNKPLAWGGATMLCVRNNRFEIGEHRDCASRGLWAKGFAAVELPPRAGATVRFREP